jgi:hypothetical protein
VKVDPTRTTATVLGAAILGGAIGEIADGSVFLFAAIFAVLGLALTLTSQRT